MSDSKRTTFTRRQALAMGGAASAALLAEGALAPASLFAATEGVAQVPRRVLGKTGKEIPILLLGGGGGFDMRFDPRLAEALRYGVNYVDAADCYVRGKTEIALGKFHTRFKNREQLWITSKSDAHDPKGFEETVDQSLERMQTDYVDMYFLHAVKRTDPFTPELQETVARLKEEGKIRHFGFSCHDGNVAELLHLAAETPWVECVMFRYNFHRYGDAELNAAIDAAHAANVGLIAMKTQGSEAKRDLWKRYDGEGQWNKYQSVLRLVWDDPRIAAAVSDMETLDMLRENIAAALDDTQVSAVERETIERYAAATRAFACDGCDHLCGPAVGDHVRIGDTIRYVMYHDVYDRPQHARELFAALPRAARDLEGTDFTPANEACPHGVDVAAFMRRATEVLS